MIYNFEHDTDRKHQYSEKWDVAKNELPMWIADMDFPTAPCVQDAIIKRAKQGIFGYTYVPDAWKDAYIHWWKVRYGVYLKRDYMLFAEGVIPSISSALRSLMRPGEKVLVTTPVYHVFFDIIENNGITANESPLIYVDGKYSIDWEDLEERMADPATTVFLLCNPHNPTGTIWRREELLRIGELAQTYHVKVISDEIHCDLVDPGYSYTPFASVSRACARVSLSLVSPSKTFNLAGIHSSAVVVLNENLRNKIARGLKMEELSRPGVFAIDTTIAAYTKGADWVDELRSVLADNKQYVRERLKTELPKVKVIYSHGTYLMWLDCSAITYDADSLIKLIRERSGLVLTSGTEFRGHGNCFLRMNAATQRERLADGVDRLVKALKDL
jgi:cystathionine beta-lyase